MVRKRLVCTFVALAVAVYATTYHLVLGHRATPAMTALYLFDAGLVTYYLLAVGWARRFTDRAPARGRLVCLVPAFEEEPELLHAALDALLRGSVVPDEIHVMDDGSVQNDVVRFRHKRITWHRQANAGKRYAQANILRQLRRDDWDFILTVDGDSVPDRRAVERLLQAMTDPKIMAATGLILTRNWSKNLLTRISDLNIGTSCLMIRTSRSVLGAVETTSGALAMYRAEVVFDNLADYVASGTNGDDRRLTMYALMRGDVVVVNDAHVHSAMPETVRGLYRQRLRWGKSAWQAMPFTAINMRPKLLIFPSLAAFQWLLLPMLVVYMLVSLATSHGTHLRQLGLALAAYMVVRYAETGMYLIDRPGMPWFTRLWTWLLLTPAEMAVKAGVIYPAKYYSAFKLRDRGWVSRGNPHSGTAAPEQPEPDLRLAHGGGRRHRPDHQPPLAALAGATAAATSPAGRRAVPDPDDTGITDGRQLRAQLGQHAAAHVGVSAVRGDRPVVDPDATAVFGPADDPDRTRFDVDAAWLNRGPYGGVAPETPAAARR
jgi:hyaluronan synthase